MITVNGWCAGVWGVGKLGDECSVNGGNGETLLSKLSPTFENIDRESCNDGSRELISCSFFGEFVCSSTPQISHLIVSFKRYFLVDIQTSTEACDKIFYFHAKNGKKYLHFLPIYL